MMNDDERVYFTMASVTDIHAYLLALSLPQSPERDAAITAYTDKLRVSLATVAAGFEQSEIPPYVRAVLALLAPRGQGDA